MLLRALMVASFKLSIKRTAASTTCQFKGDNAAGSAFVHVFSEQVDSICHQEVLHSLREILSHGHSGIRQSSVHYSSDVPRGEEEFQVPGLTGSSL